MGEIQDQKTALHRAKVRSFDEDLRTLPAARVKAEFGADSSGRVLVKELIRNAVYQAASWMREGRAPLVDGNLRSMFYQWVKPILSKLARELRKTKASAVSSAERSTPTMR